MPNKRTAKIVTIAASVLASSGVDVTIPTSAPQRLALARAIATRAKCHISTAKRHLARAVAAAGNPGYTPPQHGGARPGAGRHPNACKCDACKPDA